MRGFYPFVLAACLLTAAVAQQDVALPIAQAPDPAKVKQVQVDEAPVTVKTNDNGGKKPADTDPVMGVPPLPNGKTSMVGGRVGKIDGVRNKLVVKIFGGGQWTMAFDERTHFYRDGKETTFEEVKKGDRVYVDTLLDGHQILARNVRVKTTSRPADAQGQVTGLGHGSISVLDSLSGKPVQFRIAGDTQVKRAGQVVSIDDVQQGSLIAVQFAPEKENRGVAQEITIVAAPGENVTFAGMVTHLDVRTGLLAVSNRTDNKTYDIAFDREGRIPSNLMVGSEVTVAAVFDGKHYKANQIHVDRAAQ
jgi:hypothetical protein